MSLKIKFNCLRTNKISFLSLGIRKTLSLREFDESETHLFLSPFFVHFLEFNVEYNADL